MQGFFENMFISRKDRFFVSVENIFIRIDDQHIFTFKDAEVQSLPKVERLTPERHSSEGFVAATNKVWVTLVGELKGIIPYDHDFTDAIQNEFVSLFKWLKAAHNIKRKQYTANSRFFRFV